MNVIDRTAHSYCLVGPVGNAEIVTYNPDTLYSTYSTCNEAKAGNDCDHRFFTDRYLDNRRDHCREVENARVARENAIKRATAVQVDEATHRPFVTTSPATTDGLVAIGPVLTASNPCKGAVVATGAILGKMYAAPLTRQGFHCLLNV